MSALPATLIPTLKKLIPRLASNHDGEVVATVRAIQRVLKSAGRDLHDLLRASVRQSLNKMPTGGRTSVLVSENADLLSEHELGFITNIARGPRKPTVRQLGWLHIIVDRLRGAA